MYPNNHDDYVVPQALTETTKTKLRAYINRLEQLETEKKELADQIKEVKDDAKALGFDVKAINGVIKFRKVEKQKAIEAQMMLDLYLQANGDI